MNSLLIFSFFFLLSESVVNRGSINCEVTYTDTISSAGPTSYSNVYYYTINALSIADTYFNVYYDPTPANYVYSYVQVTTTLPTNNSYLYVNNMSGLNIDINGYTTNQKQLVSVATSTLGSSTVYVVVVLAGNLLTGLSTSISYTLQPTSSPTKPCPNNCNGNLNGKCNNGVCSCQSQVAGYDCSIVPNQLSVGVTKTFLASTTGLSYIQIQSSIMTSSLTLNIQKDSNTNNNIYLFLALSGSTTAQLVSPLASEYAIQKVIDSNTVSISMSLSTYTSDLWIAVLNAGSTNSTMEAIVTSQSNINILLIIMIVIGSLILIALIISIIYIVRKKRAERIQPQRLVIRQNSNQLTEEQIQTYFPSVVYSRICFNEHKNESSMDMVATNDCVICLCGIEQNQQVRVTYCNHVFHKACLTSWFGKQQNCPYCRQAFDRDHIKDLMEKIYTFYRNKFPQGGASQALKGEDLVVEIIDYHKSRIIDKQNIIKSPKRSNVEFVAE